MIIEFLRPPNVERVTLVAVQLIATASALVLVWRIDLASETASLLAMSGMLALIAVRKCADRANYHLAACRDASREHAPTASGVWPEAIDREPSPDEAAELEEAVKRLLGVLDPADRPVLELSLQGFTTQEIAEQLDRPERTVRRLRERVRGLLENS